MSNLWPQMSPGLSAPVVANFKALFLSRTEQFLAQGRYLSGDCSRDASNTVNVGVLQPGKIRDSYPSWAVCRSQLAPVIFEMMALCS